VDVGSGAGFDSFVAAHHVGSNGAVVGVDMTTEMLTKATDIAKLLGLSHVEFRNGLAEDLPVEDGWADVVISNGVINLCADKRAVFDEIHRVLRPGGRLQFADIANGRPYRRGDARSAWMVESRAGCVRLADITRSASGVRSDPPSTPSALAEANARTTRSRPAFARSHTPPVAGHGTPRRRTVTAQERDAATAADRYRQRVDVVQEIGGASSAVTGVQRLRRSLKPTAPPEQLSRRLL
jgi:SAM-dependent methyltransferase